MNVKAFWLNMILILFFVSSAQAATFFNNRISVQGYLKQGTIALNDIVGFPMQFIIKKNGTSVWCQASNVGANIPVVSGVFTTTLGGASNCASLTNTLDSSAFNHTASSDLFSIDIVVDVLKDGFGGADDATFAGIDTVPVPMALLCEKATSIVGSGNGTDVLHGDGTWAPIVGGGSGTVTNVSSVNSDITVATGTTTPALNLNSGTGANQIVKMTAAAKLPAVDGSLLTGILPVQTGNNGKYLTTNGVTLSWGTVSSSGLLPSNNLSDLVSVSAARTNLGLGTLATASSVLVSDVKSNVGGGGAFANAACTSSQSMFWQSSTDTFLCQTVTSAWGSVSSKPTTITGYGITDAVSLSALTTALNSYSTTTQMNSALALKADVLSLGGMAAIAIPSAGYVISNGSTILSQKGVLFSDLSGVPTAAAGTTGLLTGADWSVFNSKQAALGFTPLNIAGGTMAGVLKLPANALVLGTTQLVASGGNVGIGTATPAAKLEVAGTVKFGTSGTVISNMGVCTVASATVTNSATNYTCTGIPASTAVAVSCSASGAFSSVSAVLYARASGTVNQVALNTSAANTTARAFTCMWVAP